MNIFSSKQFEDRLAENSFSETTKYRIILTSWLISWFLGITGSSVNLNTGYLYTITFKVACLVIAFVGIKTCYSINRRIDNTNFIERFVLLIFPISLSFIFVVTIVYIVVWNIIQKIFSLSRLPTTTINTFNHIAPYFISLLFIITFYFLLYRSFIRLEQKIKKVRLTSPIPQ